MKKWIIILLIVCIQCSPNTNCVEDESIFKDTIPTKDSTLDLIHHMDSIREVLIPQIEQSEKTELVVKKSVKREKKIKKQLKTTEKELKKIKKDLKELQEELAQCKDIEKKKLTIKHKYIEIDSINKLENNIGNNTN